MVPDVIGGRRRMKCLTNYIITLSNLGNLWFDEEIFKEKKTSDHCGI